MATKTDRWTKHADLSAQLYTKTLTVVPVRRPYINRNEVVYDYHVGHEFTVADQSSPLNGCRITVCDRRQLKEIYNLSALHIRYNPGMAPVEVSL